VPLEDDADLTAFLAASLKGRVHLLAAATLREATARVKSQPFAAVILDVGMPDGSGLSLISAIGKLANPPPVVILSAREIETSRDTEVAAILVKSRVAGNEIADRIMAVVAEQAPMRHKAVS
jgi:DNA-binding response OmpR family regulator